MPGRVADHRHDLPATGRPALLPLYDPRTRLLGVACTGGPSRRRPSAPPARPTPIGPATFYRAEA